MLWIWIIAILILAGNDLNSGIRRSQMKLSEKEDNTRRKQIVIEDLQKHIQTYQAAIDYREQRISALKKTIEEQSVLIHDMEEENRNYKLIIRTIRSMCSRMPAKMIKAMAKPRAMPTA